MKLPLLIGLLCSGAFTLCTAETPQKPNVVFILADDLGWADTTLYGHTRFYQTPNIERLARRGMTFTRAYSASPLCSPTRSAIMTGLSPARTGLTAPNCHLPQVVLEATAGKKAPPDKKAIQPDPVTRLKTDYRTLAEALKDAGYATGHFGKWHLGPEPYSPLQQGFDVDVPHWAGAGPAGSYVAPWKFKNFDADPGEPDQHIEDRMAKEAVAFMEKHKDGPFFLNYWMFSVHAPFDAKKALIEKHRARVDPADPQRSPTYAAMVESMDDAVGTLLDTLDRLKIADNTIIIFTSDNGGNMYDEVDGTTPTSNAPLRGGKATLFEGGTRIPCVIDWPGVTAPGSRSDAIIQSEDFYPTILAGLGLKPEKDQKFDGISILPALKGENLTRTANFQYFPHDPGVPDWLPPAVSVHRGDWKLIRIFHGGDNGAHRYLLFNLSVDQGEKNNLAAKNPEVVQELDALITQFLADTHAVVPVPNPDFDPAKYHPELEGQQKPKTRTNENTSSARLHEIWLTSNDARLEAGAGKFKITSNGNDPWISTTGLPATAKGPFTLKLRMKSSSSGNGMVYFGTGSGFHKEQSVTFRVDHDGKFHDCEIKLPVEKMTALRLDPANAPGEITITMLELLDAGGNPIRTWIAPSNAPQAQTGCPGVPWPAADRLGRVLPLAKDVGPPKPNRTVGIFYFAWLEGKGAVYDITKLRAANPSAPAYGPVHAFHFWGEPLFGYYRSDDESVIRKHAQMLADAGVDVVFFDVTNGLTYDSTCQTLCRVFTEMRSRGQRTPQIAFLANSKHEKVVAHLMETFYSANLYPDLWFRWKGKPLLLTPEDNLPGGAADFFSLRHSWAWTSPKGWFGDGRDKWPWLDHSPQKFGWHESPDRAEQLAVAVAEHPISNIGRSFHSGKQPPPGETKSGLGWYFNEQWTRALKVDPEIVFVTGWNEWIAQRFLKEAGKAPGQMCGKPLQPGDTYFVDAFSQEFSRDIEPMKDGHGDNYYYQLVSFIRRYKGVPEVPPVTGGPVAIDGHFDDWRDVTPEFSDTLGDPVRRDHPGWQGQPRFVNTTGRNDIAAAKVSRDAGSVYFYARTVEPLTPHTDPNWMLLFIDADQNPQTGWMGYDFIVNRGPSGSGTATLERNQGGGYQWGDPVSIPFRAAGNEIELAIPRATLGTASGSGFDFKWADNIRQTGEWSDFTLNGDAAPNDRFNFRAIFSPDDNQKPL